MTDTTKPERVCAELLPCPNPWCNSHSDGGMPNRDDVWQHDVIATSYRVQCPYCPIRGPSGDTEQGAITAWNKRQPPAAPSTANEGEAVREAIAADREKAAFFAGWDANRTENAARWVESARDRCWRDYRTSVSCNEEDAGMTETPLYARPPATPDAVTALRKIADPTSLQEASPIPVSAEDRAAFLARELMAVRDIARAALTRGDDPHLTTDSHEE